MLTLRSQVVGRDGGSDERPTRRTGQHTLRHADRQADRQTDRRTDGQTDRQTDTDRQTAVRAEPRVSRARAVTGTGRSLQRELMTRIALGPPSAQEGLDNNNCTPNAHSHRANIHASQVKYTYVWVRAGGAYKNVAGKGRECAGGRVRRRRHPGRQGRPRRSAAGAGVPRSHVRDCTQLLRRVTARWQGGRFTARWQGGREAANTTTPCERWVEMLVRLPRERECWS